jgi:cell division cycle 14
MRVFCAHQNLSIVHDRVLFSILKSTPRESSGVLYFTVDCDPRFEYHPFADDFGPPSLLQLYLFHTHVEGLLSSTPQVLHFYTSASTRWKSNACLYIAFFRMLHLRVSAECAYRPLASLAGSLVPFRDATSLPSIYDLTVLDCLRGIRRAMSADWFDADEFDNDNWAKMAMIENGDLTWIIPGKILAFASPYSTQLLPTGVRVATANDLVPLFEILGITHVVRLNTQFYDAQVFRDAGYKHTEMCFPDGATPPDKIVNEFLSIAESDDVVAVHCRAGLGRTGTLIGCYLIKDCGFSDHEAIAWLRVCRPGSVIGQQQRFLAKFCENCTPPTEQQTAKTLGDGLYRHGLLVTPQKGFRFYDQIMLDSYSNNPKVRQSVTPRPIVPMCQPRHKIASIITVRLDSQGARNGKSTRRRRPWRQGDTVT